MSSSILSAYFSHIELQIGNDSEFTRFFGAKVNAVAGSRYSECRGNARYRHVHLCILTEAGLKLAETILSRFPAYVMILRNSLQTSDGMRLIDGYPMRICGNPGSGFVNGYDYASSADLVITRAKGVVHHDLSALTSLAEREVRRHQALRMSNAFAQAMVGIKRALGFAALMTKKSPGEAPAMLQSSAADHGWLRDGGMVYRLTDDRRPTNRDEIRVTMADGSRTPEACARRAGELLDRLQSTHSGLHPLPAHSAYAVIDSMGWALDDTEKDDMLSLIRAYERRRGILTPGEMTTTAEVEV